MHENAGTLDVQGPAKIQPAPTRLLEGLACRLADPVCDDNAHRGRVFRLMEGRIRPDSVLGEHCPALDLHRDAGCP
jgi:hypothetical protein